MSCNNKKVAVVIPAFKVKAHLLRVVEEIPEYVDKIYVIDDCCPENSSQVVQENSKDQRVTIYRNSKNMGVGGAVVQGYKMALKDDMDIVVKVDGDGQMDPLLIKGLISSLVEDDADYAKGSRFFHPGGLKEMPYVRLLGNAALSLVSKVVTGYWDIMDPTNGFTAINKLALNEIPLDKISERYFFENDMLFRLSLCKAKVVDFPMKAKYGNEISNLKIHLVLFSFPSKFIKRYIKRILYQYFLRDFNYGSLCLTFGSILLTSGCFFGFIKYIEYAMIKDIPAPTGMVVIPAMLIILGTQFIISFLQFDILSSPKLALGHTRKTL